MSPAKTFLSFRWRTKYFLLFFAGYNKLTAFNDVSPPLPKHRLPAFAFPASLLSFDRLLSQQIYLYQDLSNLAYARQKDSLKKAWVCPALFKEKTTQKKYKELWDSRTDFIVSAIDNQKYVREQEIHSYISAILNQLVAANQKIIAVKPMLLIDRSAAVNAYAIGGNIIAVNLGLISFSQSREEVALVLAHELSHNILGHPDKAMKEEAEWLTSDAYNNSLKEVLNSKYERYSKLTKVFEGYSLNSSRHHRYHESDADSLAIVLLANSHIGFDARFFLRLDSADGQYQLPLHKPVAAYFTAYGLSFENAWTQKRTKGLSTRSYNFSDSTKLDDSLKTHPDCATRYATTLKYSAKDLQLTAIPSSVKEKAGKIIIWNLFDNLSLTAALYRILLEKDEGNADEWYDFMMYNIISGLHHSDKTLRRFNAINIVPKEYVSKSYYELQNTLEQMPKDTLERYYQRLQTQPFWQKLPDDARSVKQLMASVIDDDGGSAQQSRKSAMQFIANYGTSMYCEFADHFVKK